MEAQNSTVLRGVFNKPTPKTRLTVELVLVTPEIAKNYLRFNPKNRVISEKNLLLLSKEMIEGVFLENGESIVFDKNSELKDGQHRLLAIIKSGKSYFIPIVRGVEPESMATYDTGKNRTAGDVLSINGFKYSNQISGLITSINMYSLKNSKAANLNGNRKEQNLTNQRILAICQENYDWLKDNVINCKEISRKSSPKVLTQGQLSLLAYLLGGENPRNEVYDFLKYLCGISKTEGTSTSYLFTKLYNAKVNREPLNFYWVLGMSIKAYNYFVDGNPSINYFKFTVDQELPKVNKNNFTI